MKTSQKNTLSRDEARLGQYIRGQKYRLNFHSFINGLYAPVPAFQQTALIAPGKRFPDVSFYQGLIDWDQFRAQSDAVIIRAGQNVWVDVQFARNWKESKARGILRGTYWFYDDRIDPGRQADMWIALLRDDAPEMECWVDWEKSYGGAFGGLKNVVAMMQRVEAAGYRVGLYTGYYWFTGNSNALTNASQYAYLATKPLWLAWYTNNPANVLVPKPWRDLWLWQYGTPPVGTDYGTETVELDMNQFNGSEDVFYYFYGQGVPEGGSVDKYMTTTPALSTQLNIRSSGENLGTANDLGDFNIQPGDVIHVVEVNAANFARFDALYRNGAAVAMPASPSGQYWALITNWLMDTPFTPPTMASVFISHSFNDTLTLNGVTYTATFTVPNVEYKPNP
jgi:GH25 family lysozyme M1 (1,4-beta-N-acetylmuramidase)